MQVVLRFARAPIVLSSLLIGALLLFGTLASISIGEWCEVALRRLGFRSEPYWLPGALGVIGYVGLGLIGTAYAGYRLIGWAGLLVGPVLVVWIVSRLGHW